MKNTSERIIDDLFTVADKMVALKSVYNESKHENGVVIGTNSKVVRVPEMMRNGILKLAEQSLEACWEKVDALREEWIEAEHADSQE